MKGVIKSLSANLKELETELSEEEKKFEETVGQQYQLHGEEITTINNNWQDVHPDFTLELVRA